MTSGRRLAATGSVLLDARGAGRALRVTWHQEAAMVVLSMWRENVCVGSFRLAVEEVPDLIDLLRAGLAQTYDDARAQQERDGEAETRPLFANGA